MIRKVWKIVKWPLIALLVLIIFLAIAIQTDWFQTWLAQKAANYIGEKTGTEVTVDKVSLDFFSNADIQNIVVKDQNQESLLDAEHLIIDILGYNLEENNIDFGDIYLKNTTFNLYKAKGDSTTNLDPIIDFFASTDTTASPEWIFQSSSVMLENSRFLYTDFNEDRDSSKIDFNHIDLNNINGEITDLSVIGDSISANINQFSFMDHSGFVLSDLTSQVAVFDKGINMQALDLSTPNTELKGQLSLKHKDWDDYDDFIEKVKLEGKWEKSKIDMRDLGYFAPALAEYDKSFDFSGDIKGTIAHLRGRKLDIQYDENTRFQGKIDFTGLPEIDQTFIVLNIKSFTTNKRDLDRIQLPPFDGSKFLKTPDNMSRLGQITFKGDYTGFIDDFVAFGSFYTDLGKVKTDLKLTEGETGYSYVGNVITENFNLGEFYSLDNMNTLSANLTLQGTGLSKEEIDATVEGKVSRIDFNDYQYQDVEVLGRYKDSFFNGDLKFNDPNAVFDFNGIIDFRNRIPSASFESDIDHLNLSALNLYQMENNTIISGNLKVEATGSNFQSMIGKVTGDSIVFKTDEAEYALNSISIEKVKLKDGDRIEVDSDIIEGYIDGRFRIEEMESNIKTILSTVIPSYTFESETESLEKFEVFLKIRDFDLISDVFIPEVSLSKNSWLKATINRNEDQFQFLFTADTVSAYGIEAAGLTVDLQHPDENLYLLFMTDEFSINKQVKFEYLSIDARNERDTVYTSLYWSDDDENFAGDINTEITVFDNDHFEFFILDGLVSLNQMPWQFNRNSCIEVDGKEVHVSGLNLSHNQEYIYADGTLGENQSSKMDIDFQGIELSIINTFLQDLNLDFAGQVSGNATLKDFYGAPYITSDLVGLNCEINEFMLGDLCIESNWNQENKNLTLSGELGDEVSTFIDFSGTFEPKDKENPLNLVANLNDQDLSFLNIFIDKEVSEINGLLEGQIAITGKLEAPELIGSANVKEGSVKIQYLNTTYFMEEKIIIDSDGFRTDNTGEVYDEEGNLAIVNAAIYHENFEKWNFDVFIDMEQEPFLALNTTKEDNSLYYGKSFVTGDVNVGGYTDNMTIDVRATTSRGTEISMPLGNSEEVAFGEFITFVDHTKEEQESQLDLSGINLNLDFNITDDATLNIIFDEIVGDAITGKGKGNIQMEINNLSTFKMYGLIEVLEGKYLFTLKNLINKEFQVLPGGTIAWYGDPLAADINLQTVYKLNSQLSDLLGDANANYTKRIPVDLIMGLDGKLLNPEIHFDVQLPTADEITKGRVSGIINSEQEMNRQAFALLILRRFVPPPNFADGGGTSSLGIAENSTEFLSAQLSNWLSQISEDFDVGVHYSPGTGAGQALTGTELAVALSTQLFNERVLISGSFGVANANNSGGEASHLIGDLKVEVMITPDGKLRLTVYNENNEYELANTDQSSYTQGLGILFQEDFNDLYDLFQIEDPDKTP